VWLVAVPAAALALAACGGGGSHSAGASTTPSTSTPGGGGAFAQRFIAYRTCLQQHGVTLPNRPRNRNGGPPSTTPGETRPPGGFFGGGGGRGLFGLDQNDPKVQVAEKACASQRPTGGNFPNINGSAFQAFTSCLKDHGVTINGQSGLRGLNRSDPKVAAALSTCRPLLPRGGFGGGRFGSTTTTSPATSA
jgi:hypothetical protein